MLPPCHENLAPRGDPIQAWSSEPTEAVRTATNVRILPVAPLIGEAIARTSREESVSSLFY